MRAAGWAETDARPRSPAKPACAGSGADRGLDPQAVAAWRADEAAASSARIEILRTLLPQLEALNAAHFGASKKIHRTLDALGRAVQGADAGAAWQVFGALDGPCDNFGTWAI